MKDWPRRITVICADWSLAMRINDIEIVLAIERYRNFNRAAAEVHMSQPALSQRIQKLEQELGCKLFDRKKNDVQITVEGKMFIEDSRNMLSIYNGMKNKLNPAKNESGELIIGASALYSKYYFPAIYSAMKKKYPQIRIKLTVNYASNLWSMLDRNEIDLAITSPSFDNPNIVGTPLYKEKVLFAMPKSMVLETEDYKYIKDGRTYVNLGYFANHSFIGYMQRNTMSVVQNALCKEAGYSPRIVFENFDAEVVNSMIAFGMGVGFVPSLVTNYSSYSDQIDYFEIEGSLAIREYMITYNQFHSLRNIENYYISVAKEMHSQESFHHNYLKGK